MAAVAITLSHQSQEATDCRWLKVMVAVVAGRLKLGRAQLIKEILEYPNFGDMRAVRPLIRSTEGAVARPGEKNSPWPAAFWKQCLKDTTCISLGTVVAEANYSTGTTNEHIRTVYRELQQHSLNTTSTSDVDACHDTVFGSAFYCLTVLEELLRIGNPQTVMARGALRTILECYITLAYLIKKNDPELWKSFRVFGAGQAKLAFLKLDELGEKPASVNIETLRDLANEDMWQEFLQINLGHWEKTDLRRMSDQAGVKDMYDKLYSWASTYSHGHWCAIRDSVFETCGNPLHRLHRIPRATSRALPDVIPDVCDLVDRMLALVSALYPKFELRITLSKTAPTG